MNTKKYFNMLLIASVIFPHSSFANTEERSAPSIRHYNQPRIVIISQPEIERILIDNYMATKENAATFATLVLDFILSDETRSSELHKATPDRKKILIIAHANKIVELGRFPSYRVIIPPHQRSSDYKSFHPRTNIFFMPNARGYAMLTGQEQKELALALGEYVNNAKNNYLQQLSKLHQQHVELTRSNAERALEIFGFEIYEQISLEEYMDKFNERQIEHTKGKERTIAQRRQKTEAIQYTESLKWMNQTEIIDVNDKQIVSEAATMIRNTDYRIQAQLQPAHLEPSLYVLIRHLFETYKTLSRYSYNQFPDIPDYKDIQEKIGKINSTNIDNTNESKKQKNPEASKVLSCKTLFS